MTPKLWQGLLVSLLAIPHSSGALAANAPVISVPFVTAVVGQTVTIPVLITNASELAFVQFDLGFAPGVVKADPAGASPSPALPIDWFFASPGTVDNVIGQILGVDAFGSPVNGTSAVANIQFKALAPGVSPLTLSNVFLNLSEQGFTVLDGQITVVVPTVPLTPGLPLLISALLLAATWLLYRRRSLN